MKAYVIILFKWSVCLLILSVWLYWDLSQAHNAVSHTYKSFFLNSEVEDTISSPTTVSIVRSNDPSLAHPCDVSDEGITYQTIFEMVRQAVDLIGGLGNIIHSGDTVLIKPNIVQQDSSGSGGVTDVRVVKALVYMVDEIDHGHIKIIVGEGCPRPYTTFEKASGTTARPWNQLFDVPGYQQLKTEVLAAGIDFRISNLNGNSDTDPWPELDTVTLAGGGYAQPQGGKYFIHKDVTHASVYINVPVLKIHDQPGFSGALKNQIGLAASSRYGFNKTTGVTQDGRTHRLFHKADLPYDWQDKEIVDLCIPAKIKLNVIDAITCLELKKSPMYTPDSSNINIQNRVKMNTIIAGYDPVAVDHVCCRVMGLNPDDIEHITLAERAGLGTNNPDDITIVGTTIESTRRAFKKGQTTYGTYGQSNRVWLLNGPYSTSGIGDPINHDFIANEDSVSPTAGVDGWSQPVYFTNDQIMLKDYYGSGGSQNTVSYAFTYFNAPATQTGELWIGSDEAIKIYLNGNVIYNYTGTRAFSGSAYWSDIVPIPINQGLNRLLVKAYQGMGISNNYNFSLNICEVQSDAYYRGNRIWGLKFTTNAPDNTTTVTQQLSAGWNLVSIPLLLENYESTVIYPEKNSSVYDYQNCYTAQTTLLNGKGYWVKYESDHSIEFIGFRLLTDTVYVTAGWNMIGGISDTVAVSSIIQDPADNIISLCFSYNNNQYETATTIDPGKGYWIKVSQNGKLILVTQ